MSVRRLAKHTTPLCWLPCGKLVCYKEGSIVVYKDDMVEKSFPIFPDKKERLFAKSNILFRGMRLGVRASIALSDEVILLSKGSMLYELNLATEVLSKGTTVGAGIRPLIYTDVKGIEGVDDGIYFGGYLGNRAKNPVHIYKRTGEDKWEVVYTFSQGTINHVHAIVSDPYRQCLWIFTGDFEEAAAIWKVTDNFKTVERVACTDQKYRGCVVYALPEGLLYATDAPFADDFIYFLNPESMETKMIAPIDGSCIYGTKWKDKYVFATTVEGDGRNTPKMEFYFGRKRGAGIKNEYVHMYCGNLETGFKEIYKEKKDCLPYYSVQFGVFKFPYGDNTCDTLYFQPIATNKNDLRLMAYQED